MANVSRVLPTSNTLLRALSCAVTQTLTYTALILRESLLWDRFQQHFIQRRQRSSSPRFRWKIDVSVLHIAMPSSKRLEPESKCTLRQSEAGVFLTPADHLKPLVLAKDLWFWVLPHDSTLSWWWHELSALSYWPPAHTSCLLRPRAPGSPPSSPPIFLPPPSAKWPSLRRTHQNPDHTTAPWAPHSLPCSSTLNQALTHRHTRTPHGIPKTSPIQALPHLHSELLSSFLIQSPSPVFL